MDGTVLSQGAFTVGSTVVQRNIAIPANADFMSVKNFTQIGTVGVVAPNTRGLEYYWQRGMAPGTCIVKFYGAASLVSSSDTMLTGGLTLYDPSTSINAANVALTAFTAANPSVITTASTAGIIPGSIVRFSTLNNSGFAGGIDFTVGYGTLTGTTFSVDYLNLTGAVAPTTGFWRLLAAGRPLFYPGTRTIVGITAATQAVITLSVDHGLTVGQEVRLSLPGGSPTWGNYSTMDNRQVTIVAVNVGVGNGNNTITVDFNTVGFGVFQTSLIALVNPYTQPTVVPFGEDTGVALTSIFQQTPQINLQQINATNVGILADSTVNTGFLGMTLGSGGNGRALTTRITGPAGSVAGDVMYWVAGTSTFGGL